MHCWGISSCSSHSVISVATRKSRKKEKEKEKEKKNTVRNSSAKTWRDVRKERRKGGKEDTVYTCNFLGTAGTEREQRPGSNRGACKGKSSRAWGIGWESWEEVIGSFGERQIGRCCCLQVLISKYKYMVVFYYSY